MKKKILSLLAAFFMLFGTSAMAQVESTLEGDVNGDGVVDIADITAVIAIIKQNAEANPTYYWYAGQTNPASNSTITSTVGAEGWRLIDNPNTVSQSNPLFDTTSGSLCCLPPKDIYLALFVRFIRSVASTPFDLSFSDFSQSKNVQHSPLFMILGSVGFSLTSRFLSAS